jgi:hypothetical protein
MWKPARRHQGALYSLRQPPSGRSRAAPAPAIWSGRSNQAIPEQLHLSPKTVEAYVRGVVTKLGLYQAVDDNRRVLAVPAFLRG